MLPPEFLDHAPDKLVELFDQVEDDILRDMARRIAKMGRLTDTAEWQAWRYEQTKLVNSDALKKLSQMSGKSRKELWKILQESAAETLAQDDRIYNAAGLSVPESMSPMLKNILQSGYLQTGQAMDNFTATTANTVTREFENALDRAWLQIDSGAFSYQQAIRQAVLSLARDGLHSITYPSGHRDSMDVAVRRAVLTGINQTAAKLQLARMDEMGCDLVETTAHGGARPEHAAWQGRVFSRSGKSRKYPDFVRSTGYGSGSGLCGWNCRHNFYPYFEGLSERNYSSADLAELNRREIEYRGKKYTRYEISQMQRRYEREIRQAKREYLALDAAGQDTAQAAVKLAKKRAAAKQFCREAGVRPDTFRQQVAGFGRRPAAKASSQAVKYYKKWADVPGFNAPETLEKYYYLKYNKPKEWFRLRRDRDTLAEIDKKSWTPEFKQKAIDAFYQFQAQGVEISDHGVARFLDRSRQNTGASVFTIDDIVGQLKKPANYEQKDGRRVWYYDGLAVVCNSQGVIVSIVLRKRPKADWREI